jgi:hypothetical protein
MALVDQANEANLSTFLQRVTMAMCNAAINVQSETANTFMGVDAAAAATSLTVMQVCS